MALANIRESELRAAPSVLGVREVSILDCHDQQLDRANASEAVAMIARHIRRVRPNVVVTFGPDGAYGHPHIAISQFTMAAIVAAADPAYQCDGKQNLHSLAVSKLYCIAWPESTWKAYQSAFRKLVSTVDGVEQPAVPWPVCCHESQVSAYEQLKHLSPNDHEALWGRQSFYRVFSTVTGGRVPEADLMEGINTCLKNRQ